MDTFWWCMKHATVEEGRTGCGNTQRLGPYDTREQAENALETVKQRTADQDARDAADNDWGRPPGRPAS